MNHHMPEGTERPSPMLQMLSPPLARDPLSPLFDAAIVKNEFQNASTTALEQLTLDVQDTWHFMDAASSMPESVTNGEQLPMAFDFKATVWSECQLPMSTSPMASEFEYSTLFHSKCVDSAYTSASEDIVLGSSFTSHTSFDEAPAKKLEFSFETGKKSRSSTNSEMVDHSSIISMPQSTNMEMAFLVPHSTDKIPNRGRCESQSQPMNTTPRRPSFVSEYRSSNTYYSPIRQCAHCGTRDAKAWRTVPEIFATPIDCHFAQVNQWKTHRTFWRLCNPCGIYARTNNGASRPFTSSCENEALQYCHRSRSRSRRRRPSCKSSLADHDQSDTVSVDPYSECEPSQTEPETPLDSPNQVLSNVEMAAQLQFIFMLDQ